MRKFLIVAIAGMLVALSMSASQATPSTLESPAAATLVDSQAAGWNGVELEPLSGDSIAGESDAQTCRVVQLWTGSRCVGVWCCHELCEVSPECD